MKSGTQEEITPKESTAGAKIYFVQCLVPLPEALLRMSLPLPGKIVTTDVSRCGNGGAKAYECRGGGWGMKNARNREREK